MQPPFVSVVIPTHNRPQCIDKCLRAFAAAAYPRSRFEVIVVDDGSNEPLDAIMDPWRSQMELQLIRQPNAGPACARNQGAAVARGELLAFTDDDCRPRPDWLENLSWQCTADNGLMVGGYTVNCLRSDRYAEASQVLITYLYSRGNHDPDGPHFVASNNMMLHREQFLAIGGFSREYPLAAGEDRDFCCR